MPSLFDPLRLGRLELPNRVLMAPMTRGRATKEGVPTPIMADYYRQRASAGLIISEGTGVSREGLGWAYAPGIWSDEQVAAWRPVTAAVHEAGGRIFCQLWHEGRLVHPDYAGGAKPVSASATKADGEVPTYNGVKPYAEARALGPEEMGRVAADFAKAAKNAIAAGFDGVEIHAANGYLIDEFLRDSTNKRTDEYGGSVDNRIRLLVEVTRAVIAAVGADRTGVHLSPNDEIFGVVDSDPGPLFEAAAKAMSDLGVVYLHNREPGTEGSFGKAKYPPVSPRMREAFAGVFLLNADYDGPKAQAALDAGEADAITFGRTFLANPDLPRRLREGAPLNIDDKSTWYTQGTKGYLDYATMDGTGAGADAPRRYLRYTPDIEQPQPDEAEAIDGIVAAMRAQMEVVAGREGHTFRASHAKSTALAVGELAVQPNLPPELAQGLFAKPGTYKVAVRFAQGPGEILPDKISTHRGMAIKVFGVEGEKLPGHGDDTQDFVLATGTTFPSGTAQRFLKDEKQILAVTKLPESLSTGIKNVVSGTAQAVSAATGGASPKADFFGHPPRHPLADSYHSQAPLRWGDYVGKIAAYPVAPAMKALGDDKVDVKADPDGFRHSTVAFFRDNDVLFDLRVQLWTDAATQPIEDASVEWKEAETPYVTVATIRLPRQDAYGAERQRYFDDAMSFRPAHSLAAHRPLGSVMRARLKVYEALSAFRRQANAAPAEEPADPTQIPA